MFCIGLTGKIASGKSLASRYFQSLGISIISADAIARKLLVPGSQMLTAIALKFGPEVLTSNQQLNKVFLRKIIFGSKKSRLWLNQLMHPLIQKTIQIKALSVSGPYTVIEIPLLTNRTDYPYLNQVLLITAPRALLINRIIQRDHCSESQALAILRSQPSDKSRKKIADDLIHNYDNPMIFFEKLKLLHNKYLQLARERS